MTTEQPDYPPGARLFAQLQKGRPLAAAVEDEIRKLLAEKRSGSAIALSTGLLKGPEQDRMLGHLAAGLIASSRGYTALAWDHLTLLPEHIWAPYAPREFSRTGLLHDAAQSTSRIEALAQDDPHWVPVSSWFSICSTVFGDQKVELAQKLFEIFDRRSSERPEEWSQAEYRREWLRPWIEPRAANEPAGTRDTVTFGVLDYGHPDRHGASLNIGDPIQTLASLGHLVRHQGVEFLGDPQIVNLLSRLQDRVPVRFQRGTSAKVDVVKIDRDASLLNAIPSNTWSLIFGWYMHPLFGMRYQFPLHSNLNPLFVSFHCNQQKMLTPEALTYLREKGPVGCRDWTTVDILLSARVDAFFTGCITSTMCTVFPDPSSASPPRGDGYIDMPANAVPEGAETFRQADDAMRTRSFVENIDYAINLLAGYRDFKSITTSRLHCYMPSRSLGVSVNFRPPRPADMRFTGLIDIDDDTFDEMRSGILDLINPVMELILQGHPTSEIYSRWSELTAEKVAHAKRRRNLAANVPPAPDLDSRATETSLSTQSLTSVPALGDDSVALVTSVQNGQEGQLAVLAHSVLRHTKTPVSWTLLIAGDPSSRFLEALAQIPEISGNAVDTSKFGSSLLVSLPEVLPNNDRVIVLPVGAVVMDDVAQLWNHELKGSLFAAPNAPGKYESSGIAEVFNAAMRVGTALGAGELRRDLLSRQPQSLTAFRVDVMLLDLHAMREIQLGALARSYVRQYNLTSHEALTILVGSRRAELPPRWAVVPTRSDGGWDDSALIHYMDWPRPWEPPFSILQERWMNERDLLKAAQHSAEPRKTRPATPY